MIFKHATLAVRSAFALRAVCKIFQYVAVLMLFVMMTLTGVDVIARYIFNRPVSGAFELTEIFLALIVFLALPASVLGEDHIKVELLPEFRSAIAERGVQLFACLVGTLVFGILTRELFVHSEKLQRYGQVTNSLEIPVYLIGMVATACSLVCFFISIYKCTQAARGIQE